MGVQRIIHKFFVTGPLSTKYIIVALLRFSVYRSDEIICIKSVKIIFNRTINTDYAIKRHIKRTSHYNITPSSVLSLAVLSVLVSGPWTADHNKAQSAPAWPAAHRSSRNGYPGHIPATRSLGLTVDCGRGELLK